MFTYNAFGYLKSAQVGAQVIDYILDAKNNRVGKKVNGVLKQRFVYNAQGQVISEVNEAAQVRMFSYATHVNSPSAMVVGSERYYFVLDHVGSVLMVVNTSTGAVVQELEYDAFGNVLKDTNPGFQPFGFAGGLYDHHTQLVRFGARDYDPEVGRWTSKDPILFNGGDTNLFGYTWNDPINFIDPSGHFGIPGAIIGGVLGGAGGAIAASMVPGATPEKVMAAAATSAATGVVMGSGAGIASVIASNVVAQMTFTGGINFGESLLAGVMGAYGNAASNQLTRNFGASGPGVQTAIDLATGMSVLPFDIGLGFGQSYNGNSNQCR